MLVVYNFKVIVLITMCSHLVFTRWRYSNILDEDFFISNSSIFLVYEGSSFSEWRYPDTCEVNNKSSPSAVMRCSTSGFKTIKPLVTDSTSEEERHLFISSSFFRLAWYAAIPTNRSDSLNASVVIRLWIIDPEQAKPNELSKTALVPSEVSQYISRQFFSRGQIPTLVSSLSPETFEGYFTSNGYWEVLLPDNLEYYSFSVEGQSLCYGHKFVASTRYTFYPPASERPHGRTDVALRLATGRQPSVVWCSCTRHKALLLTDSGVFMTTDAFHSHREMKVDPGDGMMSSGGWFTVEEAALLENGVLFRAADELLWRGFEDGRLRKDPEKLISGAVRGLGFRADCANKYPIQNYEPATVLAWTDSELYVGGKTLDWSSNGVYFRNTNITSSNSKIVTAAFASNPTTVAALVIYNQPEGLVRPLLFTYDEFTGTWSTSEILNTNIFLSEPVHLRFVHSALPSMLLWSRQTLCFSFQGHTNWGCMQPQNDSDLSQVPNGSHIHQVILDSSLNVLVKTENNVLYHSKVGSKMLIRLHEWVKPNQSTVFYLNNEEHFIMLTPTTEGDLRVNRYPLLLEAKSAMYRGPYGCPFISFRHAMNSPTYYLDKGDRLQLWTQVVSPESSSVNVMVLRNRNDLMSVTERIYVNHMLGLQSKNKTISIQQQVDYRNAENYTHLTAQTRGIVTLELLPERMGNACEMPRNRVSHFHVGCPPNRHIRVIKPSNIPCELHTFESYTIPRSVLRNPKEKDLVVKYDWEEYGCVMKLHYNNTYKPNISLYDGETFVRSVETDFIVWDMFGRTDYSFNTTMQQVGCRSSAQTMTSMFAGAKALEDAWGPQNYRSCFVQTERMGNLSRPYEVMNSSSSNSLTFLWTWNAVYVFTIRVVDPNYSFCDLQAVFTVQTYGVKKPKHEDLERGVKMGLICTMLFIICCIYCRFMFIFRKKQNAKKQD